MQKYKKIKRNAEEAALAAVILFELEPDNGLCAAAYSANTFRRFLKYKRSWHALALKDYEGENRAYWWPSFDQGIRTLFLISIILGYVIYEP